MPTGIVIDSASEGFTLHCSRDQGYTVHVLRGARIHWQGPRFEVMEREDVIVVRLGYPHFEEAQAFAERCAEILGTGFIPGSDDAPSHHPV